MTIDHDELLANFKRLLKRRNVAGLRLGALLISIIFPLFWILDWVVMPEWVGVTLWLRLFGMLYSLGIWIVTFRHSEFIYRYANPVGISLGILIGWLVAVITWLDNGYESPYYAGLNLVMLGASFLFAWPLRLSLGFTALIYGFYMVPFLTGLIGINDLGVAISNQFFLFSTMLITIIAQQYQLAQEQRDFLGMQEQRLLLQEAKILAVTDPLTGLYNRRQLFSLGVPELARARGLNQPLSLLAIDIDHFKQINDIHGHPIGDEVLRALAHIIQTGLRQGDILARIGGDEFIVLLHATDIREAASIANRIQLCIQRLSNPAVDVPLRVTISVGVAALTVDIVNLDGLLLRADDALYAAKRAGRACIQIWSETEHSSLVPIS